MRKTVFAILFILIVHCTLIIDNCVCQWVELNTNIGNAGTAYCIYNIVSAGGKIIAATDTGIYVSNNNGNSWTPSGLQDNSVQSLTVSQDTILFAGTTYNGVFRSSDKGVTWTQTSLSSGYSYIVAVGSLGSNVFAGVGSAPSGQPGIFRSTNNGANWALVLNFVSASSFASNGSLIYAGTSNGLYRSSNGINWDKVLDSLDGRALSVYGTSVYYGVGMRGIFYSQDSGSHWNNIGQSWNSIYSSSFNFPCYVIGTYSNIFLTSNNGVNWIAKNQGFPGSTAPPIYSLLISGNYIFAGSSMSHIYRRSFQEIIGIMKISEIVPSSYKLFQNYPNPFNPSTKIKFEIPNKTVIARSPDEIGTTRQSPVSLTVYDITGKEVQTLVNGSLQPGTYEATFDGSNLASGVYYYQLKSGNFIESKKLVLLR